MQSLKLFRNVARINCLLRRGHKEEVKLKLKERRSAKNLALDYFDFYYAPIFGAEWNQIRLSLLTGRKYTALVNNYANASETIDSLKKIGAFNLFEYSFKRFEQTEKETVDSRLKISKDLKVFTFDNGDASDFPEPRFDSNRLSNYYCLDGGSVLSIVALGVEQDDYILDLCASPGGKTLTMLQTLLPKQIVALDITFNRLERLNRMLKDYMPKDELPTLVETGLNVNNNPYNSSVGVFDKVLVDAPCTNDRHSLFQFENNIFAKARQDERAELPNIQKELLTQAIAACKVGGTVVYSTCTLAPIQNEGVVKMAIEHFSNETSFSLRIEPLDYLKDLFKHYFSFSSTCSIGALVLPAICRNFGPLYICKITKVGNKKV